MCSGGGGGNTTKKKKKSEFENQPVTVTGTQIGVENPKDTAKVTESLKIKRQKEEGTYKDPKVQEELTTGGLLGSSRSKKDRDRQAKTRDRAQRNFNKRKFSRGITGRKTRTA